MEFFVIIVYSFKPLTVLIENYLKIGGDHGSASDNLRFINDIK